jgi:hypothetical protein
MNSPLDGYESYTDWHLLSFVGWVDGWVGGV